MHIPDEDLPRLKSVLGLALLELHTQANERGTLDAYDIATDRLWILKMIATVDKHEKAIRHPKPQLQTSLYQDEFDFDFEGTPV